MLDVCLLGSGGMMPLPNRWLTSLLVRYNGRMLLIDCGEGTQIPMATLKWGFKSLDTILLTHYHADHVAGLPGLLLTIGNTGRKEPLTIIGPVGLKQVIDGLTVITPELPYALNLEEIPQKHNFEITAGDLIINSMFLDHALPCLAYSIEIRRQGKFNVQKAEELGIHLQLWNKIQKGQTVSLGNKQITPSMVTDKQRKGIKICYCTDTRPIVELIPFIQEADLFICEGMYGDDSYFDKAVQKKHMLFSEAAQLAQLGNVKELWLTHYSPSLVEPENDLENIKAIFSTIYIGHDLKTKTIKFNNE